MDIKSKFKKLFIGLLIFFGFLGVLFLQTQKIAKAQEVWGEGDTVKINIEQETGLSAKDPRLIIANVIKIFLGFLGLITLILMIYAGFLWMTAGGEAEKIEQAKKILKNAVIGLLIILSSYSVVNFIFGRLLGNNSNNVNNAGNVNMNADSYLGALGENIIESHYPARNQEDVPRNTKIIITFREEMDKDSIIENSADCGNGIACGDLKFGNVRIFPTDKHDSCEYNSGEYSNCEVNNVVAVKVQTKDNKTFLFKPQEVLGNIESNTKYSVYLSDGIKKKDQTPAFGNMGNYSWSFSVSSVLDLTSPKIESIFPFPDNYADDYNITSAVAAKWEINVKNLPSGMEGVSAEISTEKGEIIGSLNVVLTGKYNGNKNGKLKVYISDDLKAVIFFAEEEQSFNEIITRSVTENNISLGYGLNLQLSDALEAGNQWIINVRAAKAGDYININNRKYIFNDDIIIAGNDTIETVAGKIAVALTEEQGNLLEINVEGAKVYLMAKTAGIDANGLLVSSSNNTAIEIKSIIEGADSVTTPAKRGGLFDTPINSIIQINFDEAIDPISAGSYINIFTSKGKLDGEFLFSNQYKTVEFKPNNSCGQNSCGETIYCLPEKEKILIGIKAGELEAICKESTDCLDYPLCETSGNIKVCKKEEGGIKYNNPAAKVGSGIVDMCDNSFDGNKNMNAEGPGKGSAIDQSGKEAYCENDAVAICAAGDIKEYAICGKDNNVCGVKNNCKYSDGKPVTSTAERIKDMQSIGGDDYIWYFYTSSDMISGAPEIISRTPASGAQGIVKDEPLTSTFNRLMMSSTLKTGTVRLEGDGELHTRIMLHANSSSQVGYWTEKENLDAAPRDGYYDRTEVIIKHDKFEEENSYSGDIGSGVKDIYQNCYNPSAGPCAADPLKQCANCGAGEACDEEE